MENHNGACGDSSTKMVVTKENFELLRIMTHVGNPIMNLLLGDGQHPLDWWLWGWVTWLQWHLTSNNSTAVKAQVQALLTSQYNGGRTGQCLPLRRWCLILLVENLSGIGGNGESLIMIVGSHFDGNQSLTKNTSMQEKPDLKRLLWSNFGFFDPLKFYGFNQY